MRPDETAFPGATKYNSTTKGNHATVQPQSHMLAGSCVVPHKRRVWCFF
ncbi:MAG: hypothetical protein VB858_15160 [Planctomycetaceae bacterium]